MLSAAVQYLMSHLNFYLRTGSCFKMWTICRALLLPSLLVGVEKAAARVVPKGYSSKIDV